jgi:two-component system, sensor histidine kinase and response regulator
MLHTIADILVVEDDELSRDMMLRRLQSAYYQSRFAVNGQAALDQVALKKPDMLLLDVMLPEIMGLQVLHTLRQSYSMVDLPIIMVTAIDESERIVRALELGANDYITKPINFPILLARMQTHLSLKQLAAMNTEFLTTASRDLRKPLSQIISISNQARLKLAGGSVDPQHTLDDFTRISQAASQMNSITSCVLDMQTAGLSQIRLTKTPVKMDQLVTTALHDQQDNIRNKQLRLIGPQDPGRIVIEADKNRIRQVINHLIENAILASAPGGCINVNLSMDADSARVEVIDDGAGLREEFLQTIFQDDELNFTASGGSLGLCKQLIELHQGEIGVNGNQNNKGTTFWFTLPIFKLRPVV